MINSQKRYRAEIMSYLENVPLSREEHRFIEWISGWDSDTARHFISIIRKVSESKNGGHNEEGF